MLRRLDRYAEQVAAGSSRPKWTLLALSYCLSGVVVWAMRSFFGAGG